jgi:site-specific recombinase XerD
LPASFGSLECQQTLEQREIYRSLNTSSVRQAADAAQALRIALSAIFGELRTATMSEQEKKATTVDLERLKEVTRFAKQKLKLQDRRDELEAALHDSIVQQRTKRKQHARELDIAIQAKGGGESSKAVGKPFADALAEYLADAQIKPNTRRTYRGRLERAQAHFGASQDIRHIEQAELSSFARKLVKETPDPTTAGHHITTLGTFLNWYRTREGWGNPLTTKTLIPKKDTPVTEERHGFTVEQLGVVIKNARRYREKQPYKYWATVAAALTGCRIEELAQINLHTDLKHNSASGVWYFDLNGKADQDGTLRKSLKNKASWRCVPIHSALVNHGLIDYLKEQIKAGYSRPFESGWKPLITDDGKALKWNHSAVNWSGRELKKLVAAGDIDAHGGKLTYFHSMRHTVSQCLGRAKVTAEIAEALLGHSYADSERERYHKLKSDPDQLSREGVEPGLAVLGALLY